MVTYRIASFHPDYQFAGTEPGAKLKTTRIAAPFPMLHLLREESISAVASDPGERHSIPRRNIEEALEELRVREKILQMLKAIEDGL